MRPQTKHARGDTGDEKSTDKRACAPWPVEDIAPHDLALTFAGVLCDLEEVPAAIEPDSPYVPGAL